jgi:hypothetical protein
MRNDPEYIEYLERRVATLETAVEQLGRRIPNTQLLSRSFFLRAFAVWGHYLVASLTLAIPGYLLVFLLILLVSAPQP